MKCPWCKKEPNCLVASDHDGYNVKIGCPACEYKRCFCYEDIRGIDVARARAIEEWDKWENG